GAQKKLVGVLGKEEFNPTVVFVLSNVAWLLAKLSVCTKSLSSPSNFLLFNISVKEGTAIIAIIANTAIVTISSMSVKPLFFCISSPRQQSFTSVKIISIN